MQVRSIWTTTTAGAWQRAVDWPEWRAALSQGHVPELETPATAQRRAGERGFVTEVRQAGELLRGAKGGTVARAGVGSILAGEREQLESQSERLEPQSEQLEPQSEQPSRPLLMGAAKGGAAEAMRIPMRRPSGHYMAGTEDAEGDETLDGDMEDEQAKEETSIEAENEAEIQAEIEAEIELAAVIEQAQSKARGHGAADRWRSLIEMASAEIEAKIEIEAEIAAVGLAAHKGEGNLASTSSRSTRSISSTSSGRSNSSNSSGSSNGSSGSRSSSSWSSGNSSSRSSSSRRGRAKLAISEDELAISEDELQIFDVEEAPDGTPLILPATEQWINDQAMALGASGVGAVRGGFSAVGYFTVERQRRTGEIRLGFVSWLNLSAPFPPCECEEHLWSDLSPVICRLAAGAPRLSSSLIFGCFAAGVAQLLCALRRTRAHRRLARGRLLRALLLLGAAMPITNCRSIAAFERCRSADGGDEQGGGRHGQGGGNTTTSSGSVSGAARVGRAVGGGSNQTRSRSAHGPDVRAADAAKVRANFEDFPPPTPAPPATAPAAPRRHVIEYDGYEDARVLVHRGTLYLVANHEDCRGRRRLCLLRLAGDAASGTLRQVHGARGGAALSASDAH